jgi:hypothetical protein
MEDIKSMQIFVDATTHSGLKSWAQEEGLSMRVLINLALEDAVKRHRAEKRRERKRDDD